VMATIRRTSSPGGMNAVAVLPVDRGEVIRKIPRLMLGAPGDGLVYRPDVKRIALHGAFTLDGERFDRHDEGSPSSALPLEVLGTSKVVWGVSL